MTSETKTPGRLPIILSALVAPGLGQFCQKRRLVGAIFLVVFLVGFVWFMCECGKIIYQYYSFAIDFKTASAEPPRVRGALMSLGFTAIVYVLNLADVIAANARIVHGQAISRATQPATPPAMPPPLPRQNAESTGERHT